MSSSTRPRATGLVDTGASRTMIRESIAIQLALVPIGQALISTASAQGMTMNEYVVNIVINQQITIEDLVVIAGSLTGYQIDCLIGRDVLSLGILVYTGYDETFTFGF